MDSAGLLITTLQHNKQDVSFDRSGEEMLQCKWGFGNYEMRKHKYLKVTEKFSQIFDLISAENKDLEGEKARKIHIIYSLEGIFFL